MVKPRLKYTRYIGIDPGKSGGVAWIDDISQGFVFSAKMPGTLGDLWDLLRELSHAPCVFAYMERIYTSPQMGVKSAGTFMQGKGELLMALTAAEIPFEEVLPNTWQRGLGISVKKKTESSTHYKNRLKEKARQLFPKIKITLGNADALLIAEYLRRTKVKGVSDE